MQCLMCVSVYTTRNIYVLCVCSRDVGWVWRQDLTSFSSREREGRRRKEKERTSKKSLPWQKHPSCLLLLTILFLLHHRKKETHHSVLLVSFFSFCKKSPSRVKDFFSCCCCSLYFYLFFHVFLQWRRHVLCQTQDTDRQSRQNKKCVHTTEG